MKDLNIAKLPFLKVALIWFFASCTPSPDTGKELVLWYETPAENWMTEALPVGNGYMGVMFFGEPDREQLQFSEGSLWAGGPGSGDNYNFGIREGAYAHLETIRNLLRSGETTEAYRLTRQWMTGIIHPREGLQFGDYGAQQTMGDLYVSVKNTGDISGYHRELNLKTGRGHVSYRSGNTEHQRTIFGCYPLQSMVYHFSNTSANGTDYFIELQTPHHVDSIVFSGKTLHVFGHVADNGLGFMTSVVVDTDGDLSFSDGLLSVYGASELTLKHTGYTEYQHEFPHYRNKNWLNEAFAITEKLQDIGFDKLSEKQKKDYTALFERFELEIEGPSHDSIPIDRRLELYSEGQEDTGLEVLYLQYARYLMISSSRPGTLPMHLQGKWNNSTDPPWAADYHTNINLQMLYWPAEVTNLSECHTPLFDYMNGLVEPGQLAAREFFGARGWIVNTMNNAFGYTSPGWDIPWGFFPAGAAWLCRHAWEHFEFTQDTAFLKNTAFPLMQEAAIFWKYYLTENEEGHLASIPSFSPEHGGISSGASMDHQIAWDIFNNSAKAIRVLGLDESKAQEYLDFRDHISPPRIGNWGQLQEWIEDVDDPENDHRHLSHLYALHPGEQISMVNNPELAEAARVSLDARGKGGTGWSLAWKINFFARLQQADDAYELLRRLLQPVGYTEANMYMGGSYLNLLCAHPPFQLDGNMGGAAGITEMLIQSHGGVIHLLPALPANWSNGSIKGLKARGGFELDFEWENGKIRRGFIKGIPGNSGRLKMNGKEYDFTISASGEFAL